MPPPLHEGGDFLNFGHLESDNDVTDGQINGEVTDLCSSDSESTSQTESSEIEQRTNSQLFNRQVRRTTQGSFNFSNKDSTSPSSTAEDDEEEEDLSDDEETLSTPLDIVRGVKVRPQQKRILKSIRAFEFVYPISQYDGHVPPLPVAREVDVVKEFKSKTGANATFGDEKFTQFDLVNFSVYLPGTDAHHSWEMRGLQDLATKAANSYYLFDGTLTLGDSQRYVQRVPFKLCSIGNYGVDSDTVGGNIWIQSEVNKRSDVYYRLKTPSPEYARYHSAFVWLANFAKHFVDYCQSRSDEGRKVSIHDFRQDFARWLEDTHGKSPIFQSWYLEHNHPDFRRAVSANIGFLFKEASGVLNTLRGHPVWEEVLTLTWIPRQPMVETLTVVTPYVYECFSHLKFGHLLLKVDPVKDVEIRRRSRGQSLHLTTTVKINGDSNGRNKNSPPQTHQICADLVGRESAKTAQLGKKNLGSIKVGDVLGVTKDGQGSLWKDEISKWRETDDCWYVYVQGVHVSKKNVRSYDVIWLYKPADTTCALMKYPYPQELFFSDNCSCDRPRILEDEIVCKVSVAWGGEPGRADKNLFIRQTYLHDNSFITFKESHKRCAHLQEDIKSPLLGLTELYKVGDTVLVIPPSSSKMKNRLEPVEILSINQEAGEEFLVVKRLIRRREFDGMTNARPNELLYSEESFIVPATRVDRKCLIRFYTQEQVERREVPPPYNRDGTGDAFYITSGIVTQDGVQKLCQIGLENVPPSLMQGFDPTSPPPKELLRGLDLFSGGGNLGRGIGEGGAVHFVLGIDINDNALHSYHANEKDPTKTKFFLGSVDDFLSQAIRGNPHNSPLILLPGQIDFLSAGNPCPGYSLLNSQRDNAKGLKNQSLIADVASFIDIYRPKYALLENVVSMAQKGRRRDEDVLSQFICCIVGMGYQLQLFNLDSWSFGSPQSRSRLFVSIAAPGLNLPPHPPLSHSHPVGTNNRGLGRMSNGQAFGNRQFPNYTPFEFVTSGESTEDLPDIGDGKTNHCTPYPDHRMPRGVKSDLKTQMEVIPMIPRGMNFARTWAGGKGSMTEAERQLFPFYSKKGKERQNVLPSSKAWERVNPQRMFSTIATTLEPTCGRTGRALHWEQQRLLTVMEARRAQSFPDEEVLVGIPSAQWRIVGNSVARSVSMALGLSLREAWLKNPPDDNTDHVLAYQTEDFSTRSRKIPQVIIQSRFQNTIAEARSRSENAQSLEISSIETKLSDPSQFHRLKPIKASTIQDDGSSIPSSKISTEQESGGSRKRRFNLPESTSTAAAKKQKGPVQGNMSEPLKEKQHSKPSGDRPDMDLHRRHKHRLDLPALKRSALEPTLLMQKLQEVKRERDADEVGRIDAIAPRLSNVQSPKPMPKDGGAKSGLPIHRKALTSSGPEGSPDIINLVSDDEDDAVDERVDEDVEILSVKPKRYVYVDVDNSMFNPYEQTFIRMRKASATPRR